MDTRDRGLTVERLRELLDYNPETGDMTWKIRSSRKSRVKVGEVAGNVSYKGYRQIKIDQVVYPAGPLIWFHQTGSWPVHEIDHKNRIRHDNRWENLRDVTRKVNALNKEPRELPTGVHRQRGRYIAQISTGGHQSYLGIYDTVEEASAVYQRANSKIEEELSGSIV